MSFTTESHVKRGCGIIRHRCLTFADHLKNAGFCQLPLGQAVTYFQTDMGICDRTSIKAYFGTRPHRSDRKIQQISQYESGTVSSKTITLSQEIKSSSGYFEKLGIARTELRGKTWFFCLNESSVVPLLFPTREKVCMGSSEYSLSPPSMVIDSEGKGTVGKPCGVPSDGETTERQRHNNTHYSGRERNRSSGSEQTEPELQLLLKAKPQPERIERVACSQFTHHKEVKNPNELLYLVQITHELPYLRGLGNPCCFYSNVHRKGKLYPIRSVL